MSFDELPHPGQCKSADFLRLRHGYSGNLIEKLVDCFLRDIEFFSKVSRQLALGHLFYCHLFPPRSFSSFQNHIILCNSGAQYTEPCVRVQENNQRKCYKSLIFRGYFAKAGKNTLFLLVFSPAEGPAKQIAHASGFEMT